MLASTAYADFKKSSKRDVKDGKNTLPLLSVVGVCNQEADTM